MGPITNRRGLWSIGTECFFWIGDAGCCEILVDWRTRSMYVLYLAAVDMAERSEQFLLESDMIRVANLIGA